MVTPLARYLEEQLPTTIDLLHQMVSINTFTANADGVNRLGLLTSQAFDSLGFRPQFVQSVNPSFGQHLFLFGPGWDSGDNRPVISFISHLDTVFPQEEEEANGFFWRVERERAYGPGTVDIKGGTALAWLVLKAFKNQMPDVFASVRWLLCLDASEETLSEDFGQNLLQRLPEETIACLIFEGGTPTLNGYPLVTARKGRAEFRVTSEGRGAHAGNYHKQGANAIVQMSHTLLKVADLTDYQHALTFNPGVVHGGSVVNRVPHFAEALVEMRAFDPQVFKRGMKAMLALNNTSDVTNQDGYPCRIQIEMLSQSRPWPKNPQTDQLYELWEIAAQELSMNVIQEQRGGLSDGNHVWDRFPTLDGLGPTGNNAHCSERSSDGSKVPEYVVLSSFVPKALLNINAITHLIHSRE